MGLAHSPGIISDGLVFYLDAANRRSYSGSGNTTYSLVGNAIGALNNGTGFTSLNNGNFTINGGGGQHINISNNNFVYGSSPRTVMSWSKITSNDGSTHASFSYGSVGSNQAFFIGVYGLNPFCGAWANDLTAGNTSVSLDTWFHTACVYDGTTAYLYVAGILTTYAAKGWSTVSNNAFIGRQVDSGQYWFGNIAQVQLYNRALSATEILQNYNATRKRFGL
jgi:hypothetical protein